MGENFIGSQNWQAKSERQAQFVRFLGGVAGSVFTGKAEGAYSGANAAETTFRYNYLSHHQQKLMEAEMNAARTLAEKGSLFIGWGMTSGSQDGAFAAGIVAGVPEGLYDSSIELLGVLKEPKQTFMALRELINNDDAIGTVAQSVKQDWLARIDRMEAHYQRAGTGGAYDSGREAGKLLVEYGSYVAGVGAVAKGSARFASRQVEKFRVPRIATESIPNLYGITQSRINIMTGDRRAGWEHVVERHYSGKTNASQFSISQQELKVVLQDKNIVQTRISRVIQSNDGPRYERVIDMGRNIGFDRFSGGEQTSIMTILTDRSGNLVTVTPGRIQ
ncbi:Uncharacterised protein [Yersinia thracica]|uniref:Uncharacterized protein n=1 Tax=Yersinia thracica TaxID=2890319 RepID=A0A0T9R2D8_9GAMM|nr:Uncharacterised protein [Yersinia thracica]